MSHHTRRDVLEQQVFVEQRRAAERRSSPSGAGSSLSPWLLLALPLIGWIAITELPRTEVWDDYTEWKVAAFSAVGLQHLYAAAPVVVPVGWFASLFGFHLACKAIVSPLVGSVGSVPYIGLPLGFIAAVLYLPVFIGGYAIPILMGCAEMVTLVVG